MFRGSYVALITPFTNGTLDEAALRKMVNWQIENGTHGLVPVGTTGESPTLTEAEHKRVIEIVVEETAGRVPVIAGAGSNNPLEAVEYSRHAHAAGADPILSPPGYHNRPNHERLYQQFKMIHDAIDIPVIIYNIPPRAVVDVLPETMARLAELPRVSGVKDATGDLSRISQERLQVQGEFSYLSGEDLTAMAYRANGGHGCISVTANVAPALCAQMHEACDRGDFATALEIQDRLAPLHNALFAEPSPAGVKYAASLLGLCGGEARLPIVPMSEAGRANVKAALETAGLL